MTVKLSHLWDWSQYMYATQTKELFIGTKNSRIWIDQKPSTTLKEVTLEFKYECVKACKK